MNEVTITSPFGCRINIEHILTHSPPPQDHVLPGLLAGIAGMIVGPGGVGKTMLELQIAMALSSGRAACGGLFDDLGLGMPSTQKPGKVVMVAAEESVGVIWHRMHAIVSSLARNSRLQCDHIAPKDMLALWKENLHIYPLDGLPPVQLMDSALMKTEAFTKLISACEGARLVILDPIRQFHQCDENDSGSMTAMVQILRMMATRTGGAVVASHHTNRASANMGLGDTAGASRGSTALTDGVRWQLNLSNPTKEAARLRGISEVERGRYMMLDMPKVNYLPPQKTVMLERLPGGVLVLAEQSTGLKAASKRANTRSQAGLKVVKP